MPVTSWKAPTLVRQFSSSRVQGTIGQTTPANTLVIDGTVSSCTIKPGAGTSVEVWGGFGFSDVDIPIDATINSLEFQIRHRSNIELAIQPSVFWVFSTLHTTTSLNSDEAAIAMGDPTVDDLYYAPTTLTDYAVNPSLFNPDNDTQPPAISLTPNLIKQNGDGTNNVEGFGVGWQAMNQEGADANYEIDGVLLRVHYTEAGGTPPTNPPATQIISTIF